tara:strand:+ start:3185 stop:3937 length:753 start_codon:yes stop_codon:yes gene_type:complete
MEKIFVSDEGKGIPLVLVHGYLGSSEMWNLQKEFLSKHFRIIAPALPGFGESYNIKSVDSINAMAKTIFQILDEKNIIDFHLMGHSMGGMIVQEMTRISHKRVNKLICFATSSIGNIPGRFESLDKSIERLNKEGIKESVKRIPPKWFVEGNKAKYYYFCENAVKEVSEETSRNALNAMKNWNGYNNLKNIKNETLIIWGDKDVSYNFEQVDTLYKNISNSKLEVFKGCCHNVHLEQPQKFNETVKKFLE